MHKWGCSVGNRTVSDRLQRYLLDGSDEDLKRLLGIADIWAETTRSALQTADIAPGWNVIECGCGPAGALHVLSDLVGETGRVVGIDLNPDAIARAESVTGSLGLDNVDLYTGDVNEADPA